MSLATYLSLSAVVLLVAAVVITLLVRRALRNGEDNPAWLRNGEEERGPWGASHGAPWHVYAEFNAGWGWQFCLMCEGQLIERAGTFETEKDALRAGRAAIAKAVGAA